LAVGIAAFMIIALYVLFELDYDKNHKNYDHIYRVTMERQMGQAWQHCAFGSQKIGPTMKEMFPQVEYSTRFFINRPQPVKYEQKKFYIDNITYTDEDLFNVFTIPLLQGNPETAFSLKNSAVITEEMADLFFGETNPMGKILTIDTVDFKVSGVMENFPTNTHFKYNIFLDPQSRPPGPFGDTWMGYAYTYVKLLPNTDIKMLGDQIKNMASELGAQDFEDNDYELQHFLQPFNKIHLYSELHHEIETGGSIPRLIIFGTIGLLILIIACINYMNLATARSVNRWKEVSIRKTMGASKGILVRQFLVESLILALIAHIIAMFFVEFFLPQFNSYTDIDIHLIYSDHRILLILIAVIFITGIVTGIYPARYLSKVSSVYGIANVHKGKKSGASVRSALVVFQFTVSVVLIILTVIVFKQLLFMKNQPLGFDKDNKVVIRFPGERVDTSNVQIVKSEFLQNPNVNGAAFSSTVPGQWNYRWRTWLPGQKEVVNYLVNYYQVDHDFVDVMGIEMMAGRNFSREYSTDGHGRLLINEAAVKTFNFGTPEDAIGKCLWRETRPIIGVFKDFHMTGLQEEVGPLGIFLMDEDFKFLIVDISNHDVSSTLEYLEDSYSQLFPNDPFLYFFLDNEFNKQYKEQVKLGDLFNIFTYLALFIALLGLIGLTSYFTESRIKEIGIRKVNGASSLSIIKLLSGKFLKWALLANLIGWPVAWYFCFIWLQEFAYQTTISWWIFALTGLFIMMLAFITSTIISLKTVRANPVDALKYE
jgi:putative ABC transport system permease protein